VFLEEKEWSIEYYNQKMENERKKIWTVVEETSKCTERQKWEEKLRISRFAEECKDIVPEAMEVSEYLTNENNKKRAMEIKARFKLRH